MFYFIFKKTALLFAVEHNYIKIVQILLTIQNIDVNVKIIFLLYLIQLNYTLK